MILKIPITCMYMYQQVFASHCTYNIIVHICILINLAQAYSNSRHLVLLSYGWKILILRKCYVEPDRGKFYSGIRVCMWKIRGKLDFSRKWNTNKEHKILNNADYRNDRYQK